MRGWILCGAAFTASIVAALSFILILIAFLAMYTGQLPIENNSRSLMQAIQVMLYLLPFLMAWAWCCYMVIFALSQTPIRVWQIGQLFKVLGGLFIAWLSLILMVVALDFSLSSIGQALTLSLFSYGFFVFPIVAGVACGNIFYFKVNESQQRRNFVWQKSVL